VPLVKEVKGPYNAHATHSLYTEVHVDIEESHVTNQMEIETFHDENTWNCDHWSSAEKQEMIEHN